MTWRYVDHPDRPTIMPANTHVEVAEIAKVLRDVGLCAANVYEVEAELAGHEDHVAPQMIRDSRPTGEAVLANGNVINATGDRAK